MQQMSFTKKTFIGIIFTETLLGEFKQVVSENYEFKNQQTTNLVGFFRIFGISRFLSKKRYKNCSK